MPIPTDTRGACQGCFRAKHACDKGLPCKRCTDKGWPCVPRSRRPAAAEELFVPTKEANWYSYAPNAPSWRVIPDTGNPALHKEWSEGGSVRAPRQYSPSRPSQCPYHHQRFFPFRRRTTLASCDRIRLNIPLDRIPHHQCQPSRPRQTDNTKSTSSWVNRTTIASSLAYYYSRTRR
ncbi:hypothetical protein VTK56DRAFT_6315 [Thermocarpiscus australiensis]